MTQGPGPSGSFGALGTHPSPRGLEGGYAVDPPGLTKHGTERRDKANTDYPVTQLELKKRRNSKDKTNSHNCINFIKHLPINKTY